ncbi:MAG: hypothetical protein PHW63_08915 [Alphaproteobacteria bacterium]|nr:hypothetical protein [Alphaproteobacteria bacterium]
MNKKETETLITAGAMLVGSCLGTVAVRAVAEDLTGKRLRFFPLWYVVGLVWNNLVVLPAFWTNEARREDQERREIDEAVEQVTETW